MSGGGGGGGGLDALVRNVRGDTQYSNTGIVNVSALRPPKVAPHSPGMSKSSAKSHLRPPCSSIVRGYPQRAHILIRGTRSRMHMQ